MNKLVSIRARSRKNGAVAPNPLIALQSEIHEQTRTDRPVARLLPWLLDRRNLEAAWDRVRTAEGSRTQGLDGVSCADIAPRVGVWLDRLAEDLSLGRYRHAAIRFVEVPKAAPGTSRRLGILTVRDRVVHTALKQLLETIFEPEFATDSFGFRPGRSVAAALVEACTALASRHEYAARADVAQCFDTIDHRSLRDEFAARVADPDLLRLLDDLLMAGGQVVGRWWWAQTRGIVQGSALSPMLCNLALHPLDQAAARFHEEHNGAARLLRYADDLLILGDDERAARQLLDLVRQTLRQRKQAFREPGPTVAAASTGLEWLGVRLRPRPTGWGRPIGFGYDVPDQKVASMVERVTEMTLPPSSKVDATTFNLCRWIVSINAQLRDWRQAYLFADNAPDVFRALDDHARERFGVLLAAITGLRSHALARQYRVKLPRGYWTWEVPGARLVVLSSLAPHCPANLVRKPAWARSAANRRR